MSKRKIKFKLGEITIKNVEFEIEDEREIATAMFSGIQNQLASAVQPAFDKVLLGVAKSVVDAPPNGTAATTETKAKRKSAKVHRAGADSGGTLPLEFRHDASRFGNPKQSWSVLEKCVWLLSVIEGTTGATEIPGPQLAATYNQYFKGSGKIHPPHVTSHLGKAKLQNPPFVGEDKGLWYLTDEGKKQARSLIESLLNPA